MDLLGIGNNEEKSSEGAGFTDKIEQLKQNITKLVTTSTEKKSSNVEKVVSIKGKIIKIKESVANILSVKDQFATTSKLLENANAEVAKCQADLLAKGKELEDLKTQHSAEIKELQGQLDDVNKTNDLVSGDYEKKIKEKEAEITNLNEQLQNNIAQVSKITDDINKGMKGIEEDGVELGTALSELETEVDGLQTSMEDTEKTIDKNSKVQAETVPVAAVESGNAPEITDTDSIGSDTWTTVEDESSVGSEPSGPENRQQVIDRLKTKVRKEIATAKKSGKNLDEMNIDVEKAKTRAVEELRKWDNENRGNRDLGSKFGVKDTLPLDTAYQSSKHLGIVSMSGGSKKNKSTRKKRKAKKTQKRKKRSLRK